jgi:hypothetical protein
VFEFEWEVEEERIPVDVLRLLGGQVHALGEGSRIGLGFHNTSLGSRWVARAGGLQSTQQHLLRMPTSSVKHERQQYSLTSTEVDTVSHNCRAGR